LPVAKLKQLISSPAVARAHRLTLRSLDMINKNCNFDSIFDFDIKNVLDAD
jgi:hypothetical protein